MPTKPRPKRVVPAARPSAAAKTSGRRRIRHPAASAGRIPAGFIIVGVGASAGGLEAFTQLLQGVPSDAGLALILVQHLSPQHDSALVPLLASKSTIPVVEVTEGLRVEPNRVYVVPPKVQLAIFDGELHLRPRPEDRSQYTPVDAFFASLAEAVGARAIGVVLSGTASDGAVGVREIKASGGITIAQAPASAKYDGMPRAAIATGMVDLVLPAAEIGAKLRQLAEHAYARTTEQTGPDVPEPILQRVFELLRPVSGVDFRHYKLPTIKRRLLRRMALHRLSDPDQYVRQLEVNATEVRNLYRDLLIHVTRFFREPASFAALAKQVFPALTRDRPPDRPIRIWVAGCATGEEAYSVAICLLEYLQRNHGDVRIQIFATDVSDPSIEYARAGVYPASIEADVSADRLRRFFTRHEGGYRVTKMIRDACVFARQDLTKDPPFSRLDLVLCRNVLIYMDAVLQKKLLSIFHYALNPHGYLMLGQAETVGGQGILFSLVDKKFRIHRRKESPSALAVDFMVDSSGPGLPRKGPNPESEGQDKALQNEATRIILDRYTPAGVVVDQDLMILQFRGQTGTFLEPAPGEASLNLLKMAKEGLLYGLRAALQAARKTRSVARREGLQVRFGSGWRPVNVEVVPLTASGRQHYLVLFDEVSRRGLETPPPAPPSRGRRAGTRAGSSQLHLLQQELAASREYLQSIIQELEAANQELQSANEEILSSNEELQSTNEELDTAKEELQSTNEELNTVNEELHGRNEELSRVNSDLINLVGSVQIAIVIVSADLRIRRFTPMAEKILNLIPADLDRAIGHINPNIDCPNLDQLIATCIDAVEPIEREVQDRQGRWYALRIRPYKDVDNRIDGAVVALFDIDAPKRSEEAVRAAVQLAASVLEAAHQPMALVGPDLEIRLANEPFRLQFPGAAEPNEPRLTDVAGLHGLEALREHAANSRDGEYGFVRLTWLGPGERRLELPLRVQAIPAVGGTNLLLVLDNSPALMSSS